MNATAFPLISAVITRRELLAQVAERRATIEVPAAVLARAEEDEAMQPCRRASAQTPYGVAGKILTAAREVSQTASRIIVARKRASEAGQLIDDSALTQMDRELDEVEAFVALLRDQINAAREDRFDAEDAAYVVRK